MKNMTGYVKKLEKKFPEEWLLVEVTKEDGIGNPV